MAATTQPISIARDQRSSDLSAHNLLNPPSLHHTSFAGSPMNSSSSFLAHPAHFANPRYAGTSPRSAESSTSWSIHPGPLFVSAGSLGSTSGSLGANSISGSVGSLRNKMYPGLGCSPAPVLNPLDPDFKFRGVVGSVESDHGSLINPHMSEREVEQFRNFTCCGLPLNDLHALMEHFESHHVVVVDPTQPVPQPQNVLPFQPGVPYPGDAAGYSKGMGPSDGSAATSSRSVSGSAIPTSTDSSLAGALGPSASSVALAGASNDATGGAHRGFDLDDIDMEMDPEPEHEPATSPAPSVSSSSNNSCSNPGSLSSRSSPLGGGAGPLPLTQPQRFANANGTRSSVSSPPDTPLLTTPVSPFATAAAAQTTFPWASSSQGQGDGLVGLASNIRAQAQQQVPAGPPAFDNVTLPAKHIHGNGMFSHPYAGASTARRHAIHPLSPLSSASTSATNSPASASSSAKFAFGDAQRVVLHHTQSLYALRLAAQREKEKEELMKKAWNGYAGYEDYSRGFPGTGAMDGTDIGISGSGAQFGVDGTGIGGGAGGVGRMSVGPTETAIHPGLLFGASGANGNATSNGIKTEPMTARTTPAHSRSGSPASSSSHFASASGSGSGLSSAGSASTSTLSSTLGTSTPGSNTNGSARKNPAASSTLSRPTSSLLLSKPFKCPTQGCTKSYKQANGLKYHVTHGQCSFTPPPELSSISELGLSIGVNLKLGPMGLEGLENMTEQERRDAEREAERRLRPFCCQVKPCTRRYKNMNGLRYHYQHSGEHGAIGLRMLASGRHDATREQSPERSDEELGDENGETRAGQRDGEGSIERAGSAERGRRRERKGGGAQSSSAPSTPGPSQTASVTRNTNGPFTTQAFGFSQQQHQQQHHQQHQRSLSGSSGQQQPRSPLSQHFSPPLSSAQAQNGFAQAQAQFASMSVNGFAGNGINGVNGINNNMSNINGVNGVMNGMSGIIGGQYAFAVQSQPASAYASPWGSRAGSPTSTSTSTPASSGQWGATGSNTSAGGVGADVMVV